MLTLNSDKIKSDKWFSATYRTYEYEDDDRNDDHGDDQGDDQGDDKGDNHNIKYI